jgi:polygalacturonase
MLLQPTTRNVARKLSRNPSLQTALLLSILLSLVGKAADINVLDYAAVPDGETLNTAILQKAIDDCSASGGGEVIFPPGRYLTGSLILKSGVLLNLGQGATLLGSTNIDDYQSIKPNFVALRTHQETKQLLFAEGQTNIGIIGRGTIDGQGRAFIRDGNDEGIKRPHCIQFIDCKNIRIEDVFMTNSGAWMQHYLACDNVQIRGIRVYNHCNYNNDGIDIDGCHDVVIADCIVDSDDDGICIKSTSPRSSRNVTITNCVIHSHCNSLKLGTESTGGFENIRISDCVISPSNDPGKFYGKRIGLAAIAVEMVDGGILDTVSIDHITIKDTSCPIFIRLGNRARKHAPDAPEPGQGRLSNVSITNVIATTSTKTASNITGIPSAYAENIYLGNIRIINLNEGTAADAAIVPPERDKAYPEYNTFGEILPASGFFVRHIKNITFDNVHVEVAPNEARPVFYFSDVHDASIQFPRITGNDDLELLTQHDSSEIRVTER